MRTLLSVGLLTIVFIAAFAFIWWTLHFSAELIRHHKQQQLEDANHETMWTAYARPNSDGDWDIGVERHHPVNGGTTFDIRNVGSLPAECTDEEFADLLARATFRASRYNQNL